MTQLKQEIIDSAPKGAERYSEGFEVYFKLEGNDYFFSWGKTREWEKVDGFGLKTIEEDFMKATPLPSKHASEASGEINAKAMDDKIKGKIVICPSSPFVGVGGPIMERLVHLGTPDKKEKFMERPKPKEEDLELVKLGEPRSVEFGPETSELPKQENNNEYTAIGESTFPLVELDLTDPKNIKAKVLAEKLSALDIQVDGSHYKDLKIQPIEYIHANGITFTEGSIIKYVTRWRNKNGIRDLEKAKHLIELLIELETRK